jgi:dolichol-phosphate mannosyltransferase
MFAAMSIEKVVIVIPTYNESLVIEATLLEVFKATECILDMDIHVLVFDSSSTDNTQQIVKGLQATHQRLHLKTEPKKSGLGSAYLQAMRYALTELSADIVMEFDADLSHQPKYIAPMLEKMKTHDVVVGSRYVRGGSIPKQWGWHRKLLSVLGNYAARFILTSKYKDFTSGFRATHRRALESVLPDKFLSNQYAYKLQLLWLLHTHKFRVCEYPIEFIDRQQGFSKLPANSILDSLTVLFVLRFQALSSYFKMCLVGLSGVFIQLLVYNVLRQVLSPLSAISFAIVAACINNFVLNNQLTFKADFSAKHQKLKSFSLFLGYSVLMLGLQNYWLHLGLKYIGTGYLKENFTMMTGIVLGSFLNYLTYSRYIWRQKSKVSFAQLDNNTD